MSESVATILAEYGIAGLVIVGGIVAVVLVARKALDLLFSNATETFKARLRRDVEREIEEFRHELATEAVRDKITFQRGDAMRAKAIEEIHERMLSFYYSVGDLIQPLHNYKGEASVQERQEKVWNYQQEFRHIWRRKCIFVPEDIVAQVNTMFASLDREAFMSKEYRTGEGKLDDEQWKKWETAWERYSSDIAGSLQLLRRHFRCLLGVEREVTTSAGSIKPRAAQVSD